MRYMMLAAVISLAASCAAPAPPPADLIISSARIFTGDESQPWAEALAIRDGKFIAVGANEAALALSGDASRHIDAGGRLVTPGLTEAHIHLGLYGKACEFLPPVNLPTPGPTPTELLDQIKAASGGEGWLCGSVGTAVVADPRTWRTAIDAVSADRPVLLSAAWGHPSILNSAALKAAGLSDESKNPPGGQLDRGLDGKLTGVIREGAETLAIRAMTETLDPADNVAAVEAMAARFLRWGVTDIHLMATGPSLDKTLATLGAVKSPIRWTVYAWGYPNQPLDQIWRDAEAATVPPNVRLAGVKWVLDGTPIERGAHWTQSYADRPDWKGVSNYTDAELDTILTSALASSYQLALHVVGDAELSRVMAAMEAKAPAEEWRQRRVRFEHADGLDAALRKRAAALGIVVVQNPLHLDPAMMDATPQAPAGTRFTPDLAAKIFALKSLSADGVVIALGSDAGGDAANPWLNLMLATINPVNPAEALTREQALTAYTTGGAYAAHSEQQRGRIRVGMEANLAILSQDVLAVAPPAIPPTHSLLTIAAGKIVHEEQVWPVP